MAAITIRALSDETKARLRVRAARNGRSTEAEVRAILDAAVADDGGDTGFGSRLTALFRGVDTSGFEPLARTDQPRTADLA